jgi:hypothetical protein
MLSLFIRLILTIMIQVTLVECLFYLFIYLIWKFRFFSYDLIQDLMKHIDLKKLKNFYV